jgi:hypothetical protein
MKDTRHQTDWSCGNALNLYSRGVRFESLQVLGSYQQRFFVVLSTPSMQMLEQYLHDATTASFRIPVHQWSYHPQFR